METSYYFSGFVKCIGTLDIVAEERTISSVASDVLFVKKVGSLVCLVTYQKKTRDVREF